MSSPQLVDLSKKSLNQQFFGHYFQNIVGKECKLTDPIYNNTFDLTPLRTDLKYTLNLSGSDYVYFNLCGDIVPKCNGKTHVAACYRENGKEHVMGKFNNIILIYTLQSNVYFVCCFIDFQTKIKKLNIYEAGCVCFAETFEY